MAQPFILAHCSIPEVYGWGSSQFFEYLSLQWLGPDLYWWFIRMGKPLTSRNLTAIVWQMVCFHVMRATGMSSAEILCCASSMSLSMSTLRASSTATSSRQTSCSGEGTTRHTFFSATSVFPFPLTLTPHLPSGRRTPEDQDSI